MYTQKSTLINVRCSPRRYLLIFFKTIRHYIISESNNIFITGRFFLFFSENRDEHPRNVINNTSLLNFKIYFATLIPRKNIQVPTVLFIM